MHSSLLYRIMSHFADAAHSIYAPSASKMWINCPGSLIANLFEPDDAGFEAAEGTVAHGIAEQWLKTGERPDHLIGTIIERAERETVFQIQVTRSMLDYLSEYVDWCVGLNGIMFTEIKVWFTDLMPIANPDALETESEVGFCRQGGTADNIVIIAETKTVVITDLKYGTGVQVFALDNTQALLYAYGVYRAFKDEYDIENIVIRICQPRLEHFDVWEVSVDELLAFAEHAREAAKEAWQLNAPRRPTLEGCRWCKAAYNCSALAFMMECAVGADMAFLETSVGEDEMKTIKDALADEYKLYTAEIKNLTIDDMATIIGYRKVVENWFNRVDAHLQNAANAGKKIRGRKLVEGKSNRVFKDEKNVIALFDFIGVESKAYMKTELRSPNQMEEVLMEEMGVSRKGAESLLAEHVFKPPGKPTLVPLNDKREPLTDRFRSAFDDEDDDEV